MSWQSPLWHWLIYAGISSCLLFAVAIVAMIVTDQPARRLRFIQWAFIGALLAPLVNELGATPQWHLGVFGEAPAVAESTTENPRSTDSDPPLLEGGGIGSPDERFGAAPRRKPEKGNVASVAKTPAAMKPIAGNAADSVAIETPVAVSESASPVDFRTVILLAYGGIAGGMLLWWMLGLLRLLHLKRKSRPAGDEVSAMFRQIAGDGALAKRVQLRISDNIPAPLTFGFHKPVIVLPWTVRQPGQENALRYCLAHEWDHVQRRDIVPWQFAALMQVLFFFQPMFWWMRRQMRLCQDYLADSFAARHAEVPEDYAEFLVQQARRCSARYSAALGFAPSRSSLFRRVEMILNDDQQLEARPRRWWNTVVALTALGVVAAIGAVRLDAAASEDAAMNDAKQKVPALPADARPATIPAKSKSITYTGRVLDQITGKAISGAVVTIERAINARPYEKVKPYKRVTKTRTNEEGEYSLTLKPDEMAKPRLYIVVDAKHPKYAAPGRSGSSLARLRKIQRLGAAPFFSELKLYPGTEVTAVVVAPDGSPLPGVKITAYSRHDRAKRFEFVGFHEAKTDKTGRFRMNVPVPGTTAYWIYPKGYAIQAHLVTKQHGELGKIVVQKGIRLKGRVLDAKGKPIAGMYVSARKTGGDGEIESFINENAVANLIARSTNTNAKGEFELDDLPAGDYRLRVEPNRDQYAKPKKYVFLRQTLKLSATENPQPITLRATPHVELHARWIDSKGKPASGYGFYVFGRLDGKSWFGRTPRPDPKTGRIYIAVPHGLQQARLTLITSAEKCIRWRLKPGDKLRRGGQYIMLGNLDDDRFGIEIVQFNSPTLLVKAVDEKGNTIPDLKINSKYEPQMPPAKFGVSTPTGDVRFRKQSDGRWHSSQMQPDVLTTITVTKSGYESKPQKVSLKEGKERELVFVLKKKSK